MSDHQSYQIHHESYGNVNNCDLRLRSVLKAGVTGDTTQVKKGTDVDRKGGNVGQGHEEAP